MAAGRKPEFTTETSPRLPMEHDWRLGQVARGHALQTAKGGTMTSRLFAAGHYCLAVIFITLAIVTEAYAAGGAATAQFVSGAVSLARSDGKAVELTRGMEIDVGESVITGADGRVHLRFTDGGFISLAPGSEFRVNAYSYSGKPDGTERASLALLKGGLRTVSGLIGKASQQAYEMVTRVSTIGIRGTEYTVVYGAGVSGSVGHGRIEVCNGGGCLDVSKGESYYVKDENTKPVRTEKAAELPPRQPASKENYAKAAGLATDTPGPIGYQAMPTFSPVATPATEVAGNPGGGIPGGGGTVAGTIGGGTTGGGTPGGGTGGSPGNGQGIGFQIIGSTAPNVDAPVKGGVSAYVQNQGVAWGAGGNPLRGPQR
jgi:hypothetical protein